MDQQKVIFVVGNSRSGTTMMGSIWGNHPLVHTFNELHFFEQQVDSAAIYQRSIWPRERIIALLERLLTSARDDYLNKLDPGRYYADAECIVETARDLSPVSAYRAFLHRETERYGKTIPCEHTPSYIFFIPEIFEVFPNARIINMIRDPRDILLSQKNKWRRRFLGTMNIPYRESFRAWVNYHPYTITKLWVAAVRAAQRFEKSPRFRSVRFEDVVQEPEAVIRSLSEFVGIAFEPSMLEVPQVGSSSVKDQPDRKGIDSSRCGSWRRGRLTAVELAICQDVAKDEMIRLNYETETIKIQAWRKWFSMISFCFKIPLALVLNLGRTINIRETLKRRYLN